MGWACSEGFGGLKETGWAKDNMQRNVWACDSWTVAWQKRECMGVKREDVDLLNP